TQAFEPPFNIVFQEQLTLNKETLDIDLQLIANIIEIILINIIRDQNSNKKVNKIINDRFLEKQSNNDIVNQIIKILNDNINSDINTTEIAKQLNYSTSYLHYLFSQYTGSSIRRYYLKLKIRIAKELLNENNLTITEISNRLGFSSIYYFSKTFKQFVKMSPTEYKKSIKKTNIL
ncbi:MAG: helix-turn-helix transcriptional regulator, partial [Christensenellaceae bacterium]|nr:helix-turn-helix transcriptional regulator [Christensenellaceae bacterium]